MQRRAKISGGGVPDIAERSAEFRPPIESRGYGEPGAAA